MSLFDRLLTWVARTATRWLAGRAIAKGVGERVFSRLMGQGIGGYGWPGGWSQDRIEQTLHFKHAVHMAVDVRCEFMSGCTPNIGYVRPVRASRLAQRELADVHGKRYPRSLLRDVMLQRRHQKSLHAIKPHEEVELLDPEHPLPRLFSHPNAADTSGELSYELDMFLDLTGNSYEWFPPSKWGALSGTNQPAERWVLPAHWVWPRMSKNGGSNGDLIDCYEIRPWIGPGNLRIPPEEVIHFKQKSPIHKVDGWSRLSAIAEWVDAGESVDRARFFQFKNGCFPVGAVKLGEQYHDTDDQDIDRLVAKLYARMQGENNTGRPIVLPPGAEYTPLMIAPSEMAYTLSAEQLLFWVLAAYHTPKEVAGLQDAGTEIAMYGPLLQFCRFAIAPRLQYRGQVYTHRLAPRYDDAIRIWYDDPTPDNPDQVNKDLEVDFRCGLITSNEGRAIRGREPYAHGGDDPLIPMGVSPIPLNTGEDLSLDLTPAEQARYEGTTGEGQDSGGEDARPGMPANGDQPEVEQDEATADLLATVGGINGAIEILTQVSSGTISPETATQLFILFFGISEEDAQQIIGDTGQQAPPPAANGEVQAPVLPDDPGDEEDLSDEEVGKLGKEFVSELLDGWEEAGGEKCGGEGGSPGPCPKPGAGDEQTTDKPHAGGNDHSALHEQAVPRAQSWLAAAKKVPSKVMAKAKAKVASVYQKFEQRYGRKTAIAIVAAGILGTAVPLPGTSFIAAAPIIGAAELYLRLSGGGSQASKRFVQRLRREWKERQPKRRRKIPRQLVLNGHAGGRVRW